jgi:hypothetical protein
MGTDGSSASLRPGRELLICMTLSPPRLVVTFPQIGTEPMLPSVLGCPSALCSAV